MTTRVEVENVVRPGSRRTVDATKYEAMRRAILKVAPKKSPGMTIDELLRATLPHLPGDVFPGGAKAGWWFKTAQLDLEAKGVLVREKTSPIRLHRA